MTQLSPPSQSDRTITLPLMGCGTWAWGNRVLWDYDPTMDAQLQTVFNQCVQNGVTLFDTGDSYGTGKLKGQSEKLLGRFTREYINDLDESNRANRDSICLATKLAAYPWRLTRQSMVNAAAASAERLQRPIDLVQMHWSTANYAPWQESALLDGLADLYVQGKVKGIGLSNYGPKRLTKIYQKLSERGVPILTLQVQYSLLSTYPVTELDVKTLCDQLGIHMIAYSPLGLGLLTGKYKANGPFPKGIRGFLFRQLRPGIQPLLNCLEAIAQQRQKTMAQVALNWCISQGTIPIPGAKTVQQAQDNIGALGWSLTTGERDELTAAATRSPKRMVQNIFQTR
ncbi:MAG: aldo/keto reductase [Leptolyngbyaceae cyanobacterium]